jgi:hypothetical protein
MEDKPAAPEPTTDPVAPVHPTVTGGPEHHMKPPRQVTGTWVIEPGPDDNFPVTLTKVVARHQHLLQADVSSNDVAMRCDIIACACCGRPFVIGLYLKAGQSTNLVGMWDRYKRLAVGGAAYGVAHRAGLRGLIPAQR